jgi:hypothetical protein
MHQVSVESRRMGGGFGGRLPVALMSSSRSKRNLHGRPVFCAAKEAMHAHWADCDSLPPKFKSLLLDTTSNRNAVTDLSCIRHEYASGECGKSPSGLTVTLYHQNRHPYGDFPHSPDAYSCLMHDKSDEYASGECGKSPYGWRFWW